MAGQDEFDKEAVIDRLNLLWGELLRAYAIKDKLPLADLYTPYYYISAEPEGQEVERRAYLERWRGKVTKENLAALHAIQREINDLEQKLNTVISWLCIEGFAIVSINDLTPADLLLFGEDIAGLSPKLAEIKAQKAQLLEQKKYDRACYYRGEEKAILAAVADRFAKDYPGLYFKVSWYREKEVVFWPAGSNYDMKDLLKRAAREANKSN